MARVPQKHRRDQNLEFQGLLNDLQDWEASLKEKDKKLKAVAAEEKNGVVVGEEKEPRREIPLVRNNAWQYEYSGNDAISRISSSFLTEESYPDAASEKELGNEYFKQKKFKEAVECYSRSIALSPTAVAFANRAMAYLKLKRYEEAENDCTEALNLDDRYIKAYSRRATARKELGNLKASIEDSEFALRLEPHNQEIKKQHAEAKALYEKKIIEKASETVRKQGVGHSKVEVKGDIKGAQTISSSPRRMGVTAVQVDRTMDNDEVPVKPSDIVKEIESGYSKTENRRWRQDSDGSQKGATLSSPADSCKKSQSVDKKQGLRNPVHELATRAASRARAEAAKNITPPKSAYEFEVSWGGLSGDRALQARLLKAISPTTLPDLFKSALSAPMLIDIIKCIATFFREEKELAVQFLDNLTKVSRFDLLVMCLSTTDKADLYFIWDTVFSSEAASIEYTETLSKLRSKYCLEGRISTQLAGNSFTG